MARAVNDEKRSMMEINYISDDELVVLTDDAVVLRGPCDSWLVCG